MAFLNCGEIYSRAAANLQDGIGINYTKLVVFDNNGESVNTVCDASQDQITIGDPGLYMGIFSISFSGGSGVTYDFEFAINGVIVGKGTSRSMSGFASVGNTAVSAMLNLNRGDIVTIMVKADSADRYIVVENVALVLMA